MSAIWKKLEKLYGSHGATFAPGATDDMIDAVEKAFGAPLPAFVRRSWAFCNGTKRRDVGVINYYFMTTREATREIKNLGKALRNGNFNGLEAEPDEEGIKEVWWNPKWLPLLANGGGDLICVDLDPGPGGKRGQVIAWDHETGPYTNVNDSFSEVLNLWYDCIKQGRYVFDGPVVVRADRDP